MRHRGDRSVSGLSKSSFSRSGQSSRISLNGDTAQLNVIPKQTLQFLQGLFPVDVFEVNVIDATSKPDGGCHLIEGSSIKTHTCFYRCATTVKPGAERVL